MASVYRSNRNDLKRERWGAQSPGFGGKNVEGGVFFDLISEERGSSWGVFHFCREDGGPQRRHFSSGSARGDGERSGGLIEA